MAEAAVTFLVEQVLGVVKEYKDLISGGAEDEFHQLTKELGLLKDFLHDAATTTKLQEHLLKEMEKMIKEVVHDVEDSIDTCLTKAMTSSRKPEIRGCSLANEVKNIKKLLQEFNYATMQSCRLPMDPEAHKKIHCLN